MMRRVAGSLIALLMAVCSGAALAADFDGAKPLICSAIEANDCALGVNCRKGLAEDVNAPQFLRLDFEGKTINARRGSSPMASISSDGGMLIIQGVENRRAWSITINETSGKLVGAIAADEEGVLVFGACTPL